MATQAQLDKARALRGEGWTYQDIADTLGAPASTVHGWINLCPTSYERECEFCGEPFVAKHALARFCPEPKRCRKRHFETDTAKRQPCAGCGGPTGTTPTRSRNGLRCRGCVAAARRQYRQAVIDGYRRRDRAWEIAERTGHSVASVHNMAARLRREGVDLPFLATGRHGHREVAV